MNIRDLALKFEGAKSRFNRHTRSSLQITQTRDLCEVIADGCTRIVSCDGVMIVFDQIHKRVVVTGVNLKLRNWGTDGVVVSGRVQGIELSEVRNG
jgi:hypothetical protein